MLRCKSSPMIVMIAVIITSLTPSQASAAPQIDPRPNTVVTDQNDSKPALTGGEIVRRKGIPTSLPAPERYRRKLHPEFIERLAHCETHKDWTNGGNWAGGLGIARSTWVNYGGRQFARTPDRATKDEQIIVANRIALWGFTKQSGSYKYPVGLGGWGGLPCALPIKYAKQHPAVYPPAHILTPVKR